MAVLTVLVLSYVLVGVVCFVAARASLRDKPVRILFIIVGLLVPPVAIWSFVKALLGHVKPLQCNEDLARVEQEIENERVATFGGKPLDPSFSERWKIAYIQSLAKAAKKIDPVTGLHLSDLSLAGRSYYTHRA